MSPPPQNDAYTQGQLLTLAQALMYGAKTEQDPLLGRPASESSQLRHYLMPFVAALRLAGLSRALVLCLWELPAALTSKTSHQCVL